MAWYPGKYAKEAVSKAKSAVSKAKASAGRRRLKKLAKEGKVKSERGTQVKPASYTKDARARIKKALPGAEKTGTVSKGAVGAVQTKGGTYVKYKKESKEAGSFRTAFKLGCEGGAKGFSWQGRKYSCKKK